MQKRILLILCVILSCGFIYFIYMRQHATPAALPEVWVQASTVHKMALPLEIEAIGTLVARSVEMTPEVAGTVKAVLFEDGSFVKQGEPLIQLDDAVYQAKYKSAQAQLTYSTENFKRMRLLSKQGAVAQQAVDQAEADLKEKTAAAKESEVMLNKMKLTAPFSGVVGKSQVSAGSYVTIGQPLVTLTETSQLHVEYNVAEKYLPRLKRGQQVTITSTTYPEKKFIGKLAYIAPTINSENRSISLYADVPNLDNRLVAGMFVNVTASLDAYEQALMIPAKSLIPILAGDQVYKIVEGKAFATNVLIGHRTATAVQVIDGLVSGDQVITDGQLKVKNGMPVKIKT